MIDFLAWRGNISRKEQRQVNAFVSVQCLLAHSDNFSQLTLTCLPRFHEFQLLTAAGKGRADEIIELLDEGAALEFKDSVCFLLIERLFPASG
jgi:hypothetical protein